MTTSSAPDHVVLLDEDGRPIGSAPRPEVHTRDTPLHLAFSCYLFDDAGRLLMTRRALSKKAWPGVWTNSFCGHPRPGEESVEALHRYAAHELGVEVDDVVSLVPDFRYRAVDPSGIVENEVCPVYAARVAGRALTPHPDEVVELRWIGVEELTAAVRHAPWTLSPWLLEQVPRIEAAAWPFRDAPPPSSLAER